MKSKGHSAGSAPQDKKEGAVSNPQPSQFGFSPNAFTLRRVGSRGECLSSGQSVVVELTWFILPCATQDVMGYELYKTLVGMKMLKTVHNVAKLGKCQSKCLIWFPGVCIFRALDRGSHTLNLGIETQLVDFKASQPSPPPSHIE